MHRENRKKTAIERQSLSRPTRLAFEAGLLTPDTTFFDYGCGRGGDLRVLKALDINADGWDPAHRPRAKKSPADIVNLGYVVNVIEDPTERRSTLHEAWKLAEKLLIVSARLEFEKQAGKFRDFGDGCVSAAGTFQKFFHQDELRDWIKAELDAEPVAAGPGIFYVFRDDTWRERHLASTWRRKIAIPVEKLGEKLFEAHREQLQPLMAFVTDRGRLPDSTELPNAREILETFGSIDRAFGVVVRVTGAEAWDAIRDERRADFLVYLALDRFGGRPKFSQLPADLQWDVKAFFGSYREGCDLADKLLFAAGNLEYIGQAIQRASIGKKTQDALYVHVSALDRLAPILRVYEGCARTFLGQVDDVELVKLAKDKPKVSYLSYPEFDADPHPSLARSMAVSLSRLRVRMIDYRESENPPVLHRKEEFVAADYPGREKFARLTRQEERKGLYAAPSLIGTKRAWEAALRALDVRIRGHRLVRAEAAPASSSEPA